jgi:ABC-2 type transport system ATP-binding protein
LITVDNLSFEYPGVRALDEVSFTVEKGSVVALVGPNGAGKTTLLRCLAALDQPLSGSIHLDGANTIEQPRATHRKTGYLPDFFGLYEDLTVEQCLTYHACAHGIASENIMHAVQQAAERLDILDRIQVRAKELSRGLRQRLAIAQAIVHEPPLLLLDEPASGLDPEARHSLAALFLSLRDLGMTLIVSSHILTELEAYSTHMLIMRQGKIVSQDVVGGQVIERCQMRLKLAADFPDLVSALETADGIADVQADIRQAFFSFSCDRELQHRLLKRLFECGVPVASFAEEKRDMHEAYLDKMQEARDA